MSSFRLIESFLCPLEGCWIACPFPSLWGGTLAIYDLSRCELLGARTPPPRAEEDAILLRLNRHLEALSQGFGLPEPVSQLLLFPAVGLKGTAEGTAGERRLVDGGRA